MVKQTMTAMPYSPPPRQNYMEGKRAKHFHFSNTFAGTVAGLFTVVAASTLGLMSMMHPNAGLKEEIKVNAELTRRNVELQNKLKISQKTIEELRNLRDLPNPVTVCPGKDIIDDLCLSISRNQLGDLTMLMVRREHAKNVYIPRQ